MTRVPSLSQHSREGDVATSEVGVGVSAGAVSDRGWPSFSNVFPKGYFILKHTELIQMPSKSCGGRRHRPMPSEVPLLSAEPRSREEGKGSLASRHWLEESLDDSPCAATVPPLLGSH